MKLSAENSYRGPIKARFTVKIKQLNIMVEKKYRYEGKRGKVRPGLVMVAVFSLAGSTGK